MSHPSSLPLYVRISEGLIRDIQAGRLIAGERLPPERELATSIGTSVGTLRKALADLEDRGLLERRQGSGNYVRETSGTTGVYAFFRLERPEGGGLPTADVLSVRTCPKPAGAPDFGAAPNAHRIRRIRSLDGLPVALEEIWLDGGQAKDLGAPDLSESLYHFYRTRLGLWIGRVEDRIGMDAAPAWTPERVPLEPGAPCGYVERIAWTAEGAPVEFSRTWFDSDSCRYTSRLR
ncbi:MAG: GntR family transcriptional regulator [Pseudomonadota bacterium]